MNNNLTLFMIFDRFIYYFEESSGPFSVAWLSRLFAKGFVNGIIDFQIELYDPNFSPITTVNK